VAACNLLIQKRRRSESNRRIKVLQTSALPLGYAAKSKDEVGRRKDEVRSIHPSAFALALEAGDEIRTRDFDLGKVALYH
jgi:hypothetical protein